ncbi:MAG TPA: hypothetical protein VEW92_01410 [Nitrososphaeraceae archaeon]|nr:hypothetical protein [Nitrososphaeraceae archaeon]
MQNTASIYIGLVAIVLASFYAITTINNSDSSSRNNQLILQTAQAQSSGAVETTLDNTFDMGVTTNSTVEKDILQQGMITSSQARQNETSQLAVILPHRADGKSYTGILTFSASRPVEVGLLQRVSINNDTLSKIDLQKFGETFPNWIRDISTQHKLDNNTAMQTISSIIPDYGISTPFFTASIPFVANGVALWSSSGEPFITSYQVSAKLGQPELVNDIEITTNNTKATTP